jgi:signal transduction histidine kinase
MKPPISATMNRSNPAWYIFILLVICAVVATAGIVYIQQQKRFLIEDARKELGIIADLKTSQIVQWRKERLIEATSIHTNSMMSHRVNDYINGEEMAKAQTEFRTWMTSLRESSGYSRVTLFKADATLITSVSDDSRPLSIHYRTLVETAAKSHEIIFSDFHRDDATGDIDIDLIIPIIYSDDSRSRCIAVIVIDIDPQRYLYPLIQSWPALNRTAETLLVKRDGNDVLFLNKLRFTTEPPLTFRRPLVNETMPATRAVLGQEGIFEGTDYRGVKVLSAIRTIPGSPWSMVAKLDDAEVFEPIKQRLWIAASTCILMIVVLSLGVSLFWLRRQQAYLGTLYENELQFNSELKEAELSLLEARDLLETRVTERTAELSESLAELRRENMERKRLELQLLSIRRLEAIGQIAGGVAHEVRNPLNAILTITEALFKEKVIEANPEYEPYIQHIRTQVNRLVHLMNDLLDLGRTIPTANLQPIPLYEICRETLDLWKSTGLSKNKRGLLSSDNDDISIKVLADGIKLQQVFFNLLENAGHHSLEGEKIVMRLTQDTPGLPGGMTAVQVIDQGTGIPEDKLSNVFEPFYTDRKGGTGLGLALVRHFIESMGGSVRIWNNSPPPGCTVEVHIPLCPEAFK